MNKELHGLRETVNFAEGAPIVMYENDQPVNYPNHWHSPIEIIMPVSGEYRVVCGERIFELNTGDILLIAPGTLHSLFAPKTGRRLIVQVDFSILRGLKEFNSIMAFITPAICISAAKTPEMHAEAERIMRSILQEHREGGALKEPLIYSYLIQMIVLIGRRYTAPLGEPAERAVRQPDYVEKFLYVCDYINQHFDESLTLDDAAALAGFSKFYFTRLFKQFTGVSFYKYLNRRRIMYAEQLLIEPQTSVTEAAIRSGFGSLSAFIRMFKLHKGCTPSEFRMLYLASGFEKAPSAGKT